jgi:hypothetical protein
MLRNLNQRSSGRRICGTSHIGTKGLLIPTGSAIRNLDTPADDNKEYRLRLLTWPASGSLFMYEDGTSVFIPTVDGAFTATGQIAENGIDIGSPVMITYQSGVAGTTVACNVGTASAAGSAASVQQGVTISCATGNAVASGQTASVSGSVTVSCGVGVANAAGSPASLMQGASILCSTGGAAAAGANATITAVGAPTVIVCQVGLASADGLSASVSSGILIPNAHQFYTGRTRQRLYTGGQSMNFSPKRATETEIFAVDFAPLLAVGETIQSAVWTSTVVDGIDPTPNATISGVATISGTKVSNKIAAGIPGVRYAPICTAQTSLGQMLVLPEYGHGLLLVTL